MPAPFISSLCGYREGRPNTSDKGDQGSVALGKLFFEAIGIKSDAPAPTEAVGNLMTQMMSTDLAQYFDSNASHLRVEPERPFTSFEQFSHLKAAAELRRDLTIDVARAVDDLRAFSSRSTIEDHLRQELQEHLDQIESEVQSAEAKRRDLLDLLGEESLLKLDITVSRATLGPSVAPDSRHLVAGFSLKWTLRTDRAQDCRSQGAKMASLRRGRMPHFATVTIEPRPAMLALLGRGSGDLDCVYHLHLPALQLALDEYCSGSASTPRLKMRDTFRRLCDQRRLRDYDELRNYTATL
ncbi:NgoMIV family type II restriction endonuclease [Streptomyces sp. NPDC048340]|uniref:NgoMIV family type II restriction endonuclease n=1 Tax=Streptomyces sp. NPDC048340 TaxID=3365537 RepID=UPI003711A17C